MAADGLALTFWKAQSCLADEFRGADGESVAPPPRLRAARTAAMAAADEGWNVDAGLALSRPAFRAAVREIVGKQGFGRHLAACALLYEYVGPRAIQPAVRRTVGPAPRSSSPPPYQQV